MESVCKLPLPETARGLEDRADVQRILTEVPCFHGETSNSPSALGQLTNCGVEVEKRLEPGRRIVRRKRAVAQTGGEPSRVKRPRASNYTEFEKIFLLLEKLGSSIRWPRGVSTIKNDKSWAHHVSEHLGRNWKSCQQQWYSLLKSYNRLRDHESNIIAGIHVSYWELTEPQMDDVNKRRRRDYLPELPRGFKRMWYEIIECIYQIQQIQDGAKKIPSWIKTFQKSSGKVEANLPSPSTAHITSTITNSNTSPGGPLDATKSQPTSSKEVQESMDPPEPLVSDQDYNRAEVDVLQGEFHDAYISMVDPFIKKMIEEALKPHWDSVLRSPELETKPKDHKRSLDIGGQELPLKSDTLALEHEKVAVAREKVAVAREKVAVAREKVADAREKVALKREKLAFKSEKQTREKPVKVASEREKLAFERQKVQLKSQGASTSVANTSGVV